MIIAKKSIFPIVPWPFDMVFGLLIFVFAISAEQLLIDATPSTVQESQQKEISE